MSGASDEEMSIRAYLLGELPSDAQVRIEEHLLADRDLVEMLLIIEDELTDSYLRGALSDRERTEFENYFLKTPARRVGEVLSALAEGLSVGTVRSTDPWAGYCPAQF